MSFAQLPRGRHGIPREVVEHHQRERIFAAVAAMVAEQGYAELTVRKVIRAAGISTVTFYALFDDKRTVLLAAYDAISARFLAQIEDACRAQVEWPEKVRAVIATTVRFADVEPESARFLWVAAFASTPEATARVFGAQDRLATMLASGRRDNPRAARLPALTEQALVAAIWSTIAAQLSADRPEAAGLQSQLVELALIPYLGYEEAARVATHSE